MKKTLISVLSLVCSLAALAQGGEMTFDGEKAAYEILNDRRVGPGTKYTEYYFNNIGSHHYSMRALVVEIDNANQYTYQSPYMANYDNNQRYHEANTKSAEYEWQDANSATTGRRPIATVMSGAFTQDSHDNKSVVNEVGGGLVCNGIMHYMPQSNALHYYVDGNGNARIGVLRCNPVVTAANAGEHSIAVYNRMRSNVPDGITLFANGYGRRRSFRTDDIESAKDLGTEVIVTLDDVNTKISSGTYTGKVSQILSGTRNTFEKGQVVLASVEGEGEQWLKKLAVGEKITLNLQYYDAQNSPVALQACTKAFNGYAVKGGVAQAISSGNLNEGYAEDVIGLSADGKKSYYIHLDNWLGGTLPSNATVSIFNQFVQQLGVYDAVLMDGGPSAEMLVKGEWVSQSVMHRPVPASIMVYSTAAASDVPEEADFTDHVKKLYVGKDYTPQFDFFNQYGDVVVPSSGQDVVLSCEPADLGTISADGRTFTPKQGGKGILYATYKGRQDQMYVDVADAVGLRAAPEQIDNATVDDVINATLYKIGVDGSETVVDNSLATWTTNNLYTVQSCANGVIKFDYPGVAEIYADYAGMRAVITVTVISGIEQIKESAPVRVSAGGGVVSITANDSSVKSMSCQVYTADGRLVSRASVNGSSFEVKSPGAGVPVIIVLTVDGKRYVYKLV